MATWTNITDAALEPGRPIRSVDGLALRDNAIAIAEGAVGAPRIDGAQSPVVQAPALFTGTPERDWVLARTAGAGAGVVGSYAFASAASSNSFGSTRAGSQLTPSSASGINSGSLSGTWRCMGFASATNVESLTTLWLRIS